MALFEAKGLFYKAGEGSGGSDPHNLGYYADLTALQTAHPTGADGDFAILGSTDTVWLWDSGTSAWVDSDQKGQVTSVNNQTGAVTLGINDVAPTQTGKSGYVLGTDGFVAGWVRPEIVQRSALPQASEEEVDKIYQYVGTTDANYTNGYFYKCVSDGQTPATYSWENIEVQPVPNLLPDQTGNAGKFLQTDGTDASWSALSSKTTATLLANGWTYDSVNSRYEQTVNVAGVTASNDVEVSPYAVNYNEWGNCGVFGAAQAVGTITFWADSEPTNDLQFTAIIRA